MKATLTFDLREERDQFDAACNADKWVSIVSELDEWLRSKLKYEVEMTEAKVEAFGAVRTKLHELLAEDGLSLL